jgi:hypothetical protein
MSLRRYYRLVLDPADAALELGRSAPRWLAEHAEYDDATAWAPTTPSRLYCCLVMVV